MRVFTITEAHNIKDTISSNNNITNFSTGYKTKKTEYKKKSFKKTHQQNKIKTNDLIKSLI